MADFSIPKSKPGLGLPHYLEAGILRALVDIYPKAFYSEKELPGYEHPRFRDLITYMRDCGLIDVCSRGSYAREIDEVLLFSAGIRATVMGIAKADEISESTVISEERETNTDDAVLGAETRRRYADMGKCRHAEAKANAEWWEPFIAEGLALVAKGQSKQRAAEIVARNHPEAEINPGTLRQKL